MDFLPVVLLVQGHFCLDATKVDVALSKMHPKGVVKDMIIYIPSTSTTTLHLEDVHSLQFSGTGVLSKTVKFLYLWMRNVR